MYTHINRVASDSIQQHYREHLHKILSETNTYEEFVGAIESELNLRYEIYDWAFSFLNLPDKLVIMENFGTVHGDYVSEYLEEHLYNHDLLLHHVKIKNTPVFQSDIIDTVNKSGLVSYNNERYKQHYKNNFQHGFKEICCIPITSPIDGNRCLFTVTSRKIKNHDKFKSVVTKYIESLTSLAISINNVGLRKYKSSFLKALNEYAVLSLSKPLTLLVVMGKYDLDTREAAERIGIPYNTAKNQIAKIKDALGATTIHGAYNQAIENELVV